MILAALKDDVLSGYTKMPDSQVNTFLNNNPTYVATSLVKIDQPLECYEYINDDVTLKSDWEQIKADLEVEEENNSPEPLVPLLPLLTPVEFKLLFTPTERIAIKNTRPTDEILDDFMDIIDDPRLDTVNFNLQSTKDAIDYLVSIEVLTVERAVQVKTGVFL
jgi:hypothetical protein